MGPKLLWFVIKDYMNEHITPCITGTGSVLNLLFSLQQRSQHILCSADTGPLRGAESNSQ